MFINKEGKLFGKVSIIDIFVILVIVVAAFGIYTRFFAVNERVAVTENQLEYQFKIDKVRQGTYDAIAKLGPVYDKTTKEYMGEIIKVEAEECYESSELADGRVINSLVPERMDLIVTVKVNGSSNDTGYYTSDNKFIAVGSGFTITTKYAETTGEVVGIKEIQ